MGRVNRPKGALVCAPTPPGSSRSCPRPASPSAAACRSPRRSPILARPTRGPAGSSPAPPGPRGGGRPGPPFVKAAATYLGLETKALCDQLKAGKTLADVAAAQNKSVDGLKQAIYDDAKSHLDKAVADGTITADQEQTRLTDLQAHLDDIVNKTPPKGGPPKGM